MARKRTVAPPTEPDQKPQAEPLTIHVISHNHWDREWIFTARYTNRWLVPFFDNLLRTLKDQPRYRFVLDGQTVIIEDYLDQLSKEEALRREAEITRLVREGRLLVGPSYLQPDWTLVSGEALVRNLMIGHRISSRFGVPMKIGWLLDNFGQIAQAPQILKGFGIDGAFVWRGVSMEPENLSSEFWWEAPDGSRVLAIYLINSYRNAMVLSVTREIARERILSEALALRPFATTPNVLLMNGYEQVPWPDDVLPIIEEFNQRAPGGMKCVQSTPVEYLEAVRDANPRLLVLSGYFYSGRYMPVLKGVFSSRSHLKLMNNECQRELERWAEPFAAIAWTLGAEYPAGRLERAWKTLLLNHAHDDMCGCCIDPIAREMEDRFKEVFDAASDLTAESLKAITNAIDTSKVDCITAVVVFNPSPRVRTDVVSFSIEIPEEFETFTVRDGRGVEAACQIAAREGRRVDLYLYATEVPSLGYKTYYFVQGEPDGAANEAVQASEEERVLENRHLRVEINDDGSLNLIEKQSGRRYTNLGYFEDGGDAGDTYDYSYPETDTVVSSLGRRAEVALVDSGPLVARFRIEIRLQLPVSLEKDRRSRGPETRALPIVSYVELTAGAQRAEIKTILVNSVKDHRLRVLFPTGISADHCHAEEPFDVARWPVKGEAVTRELPEQVRELMVAGRYKDSLNTNPFQNFVDYSDGEKGLSVISRRVTEYEILPENGAIALTLLRSVGWLARYDLLTREGDVGPHIFTPEAQCLGEHVFYYALYPHGGEWSEDSTQLQAFSHNLRLRAVQNHDPGNLPDEMGFLSLLASDGGTALRLTALKRAEDGDGLIVRFFNTLNREIEGELDVWWKPVERVLRTNLNEEATGGLTVEDGRIRLMTGHKEIVTLKVKVKPSMLIDALRSEVTRVLPPLPPGEHPPSAELPPVLTKAEVQAERDRLDSIAEALVKAKADVFNLEDEIERTASRDIARKLELQKLRMEVASLTRKLNEARISALLNRQLYLTRKMEAELEEIGEAMSWSRTKKRAGEYLVHYYSGLLRKQKASEEVE